MSGRGKGGKVKGKAKSRSSRAGLQFPVGRIHRLLRWLCSLALLYSTWWECVQEGQLCPACGRWRSSLHGCSDGILSSRDSRAGRECRKGQQEDQDHTQALAAGYQVSLFYVQRLFSISYTVLCRNDEELNKLLAGVTIAQGGVLPNIQAVLLPKKSASSKEKA